MRVLLLFFTINIATFSFGQQEKVDRIIEHKNKQICSCLKKRKTPSSKRFEKCFNKSYSDTDIDSLGVWSGKKKKNPQSDYERFSSHFSPLSITLTISERLNKSCPTSEQYVLALSKKEFIEKVSNHICEKITSDKKEYASFWDVSIPEGILKYETEWSRLIRAEYYLKSKNQQVPKENPSQVITDFQKEISKYLRSNCKYFRKLYRKVLRN